MAQAFGLIETSVIRCGLEDAGQDDLDLERSLLDLGRRRLVRAASACEEASGFAAGFSAGFCAAAV